MLFLSDHVDLNGAWELTHGTVQGDEDAYPHTEEDYREAVREAVQPGRPLIIAGHNAFAGGNRPARIQDWLTPLPPETVVHLYGHAHIGDERNVPPGSGHNAYRTISYVDDHQVPQIDISSLEDLRGDVVRSAVLETYIDGGCSVHIRDHSNRSWLESYTMYGPQRPYIARLSALQSTTTFSNVTHSGQLRGVIDYLDAEHDLLTDLSLPYRPDGSNIAIENTSQHADGSSMRQPDELPNGWYLEGGLDRGGGRHMIEALATACGFSVEFDGSGSESR